MGAATSSDELFEVLERHQPARASLVPILQDVQERLGYLPRESLDAIARYLGTSTHAVFGVATFYTQFRFREPARHAIQVCLGTACHVRGGALIMRELSSRLGIEPGQHTPDGEFSLDRVACFGSCALAPVAVVDGKVHGLLSPAGVEELTQTDAAPEPGERS
jgi:NADH-quinone oxidoreductase subunit E